MTRCCGRLSKKSGDGDLALAAVVREALPYGGRGCKVTEPEGPAMEHKSVLNAHPTVF